MFLNIPAKNNPVHSVEPPRSSAAPKKQSIIFRASRTYMCVCVCVRFVWMYTHHLVLCATAPPTHGALLPFIPIPYDFYTRCGGPLVPSIRHKRNVIACRCAVRGCVRSVREGLKLNYTPACVPLERGSFFYYYYYYYFILYQHPAFWKAKNRPPVRHTGIRGAMRRRCVRKVSSYKQRYLQNFERSVGVEGARNDHLGAIQNRSWKRNVFFSPFARRRHRRDYVCVRFSYGCGRDFSLRRHHNEIRFIRVRTVPARTVEKGAKLRFIFCKRGWTAQSRKQKGFMRSEFYVTHKGGGWSYFLRLTHKTIFS